MTITYQLGDSLYVNVTNRCSNSCFFCVRNGQDAVGSAQSLWLEREPTKEEIVEDILKNDLSRYKEIVFCGFGEPLMRFDAVVYACGEIKKQSNIKIRINTNGQADLIKGEPTAQKLSGLVDAISISLNASNAKKYQQDCRSDYGEEAFDAMLRFTADCKQYIPEVVLSVVDIIGAEEVENCRAVAEKLGVKFRVREMIK